MSLFNRAAAFSINALLRAQATEVELRRGEQTTSNVPVAIGESNAEIQDADGFTVEDQTRDYLIRRADYKLGGVPVEPQEGDLIVETFGEETVIYQLLPLAKEPAKRFWDRGRTVWRCHTKHDSEESS